MRLAEEAEACLALNIFRSPLFPVVRQRCANASRLQVPVDRVCNVPISISRHQARRRPQRPRVLRTAECTLTGPRRCNNHQTELPMVPRTSNSRPGRHRLRLPRLAAHNLHLRDHRPCLEGRRQGHLGVLNVGAATSASQISTACSSNL